MLGVVHNYSWHYIQLLNQAFDNNLVEYLIFQCNGKKTVMGIAGKIRNNTDWSLSQPLPFPSYFPPNNVLHQGSIQFRTVTLLQVPDYDWSDLVLIFIWQKTCRMGVVSQ